MLKRKFFCFFVVMFLMLNFLFVVAEDKLPEPTQNFYVADYANVLDNQTKNIIISTNKNFEKTTEKPQVVVATVPNMDGNDVVSYTVELFKKWKIGNKDYNNGVLVLLSLEERKIRIEVGYGLEGTLPDGKVGEILDNAKYMLSDGDYSKSIENIFFQVVNQIDTEYNYESSSIDNEYHSRNMTNKTSGKVSTWKIVLIAVVILVLIALDYKFLGGFLTGMLIQLLIRGFFRGGGGSGGGGGSFGGGGRSGGGGADRGF